MTLKITNNAKTAGNPGIILLQKVWQGKVIEGLKHRRRHLLIREIC
jgi:hypothetical protein